MTQAIVVMEGTDGPTFPVVDLSEPEPYRFALPLVLGAGWIALFAFVLTFLWNERDDSPKTEPPSAIAHELLPPGSAAQAARLIEASRADAAPAPVMRPAPAAGEEALRGERAMAAPEPSPAAPTLPGTQGRRAEFIAERPSYVGLWGPTARACGIRARRQGLLPANITETGAKAGGTACRFRNPRREGTSWTTLADCSAGGQRWTSQVRLSVQGNTLNWVSERGPASYVRCGRRLG